MKLALIVAGLMAGAASIVPIQASAATIFGVDENNRLVTFDSASPSTMLSSIQITGSSSSFQALDFRPVNNALYGLSTNRQVFTINTATGVATAVGSTLALGGNSFGFDFNPTIDRVRIVSNTDRNYVFNPENGSVVGAPTAAPLAFAAGDPNQGANPGVTAAAYTSSTFGAAAGTTQLYVLDTDLDVLARQNNNGGVLTTVGGFGADLGSRTSFDISGTDAFAFNGSTLYRVDLNSGALTSLGNTDRGLFGIAIAAPAVPEPATWAMMMLGFGAVGYAMRRRPKMRYQQAI